MKVLTTLMLSTALLASGSALADDDHRKKHHRGDRHDTHEHKRFHGDDQRYYGSDERFFCDDHKRHHDLRDFRRHHGGDERAFRKHLSVHVDHGWAGHHGKRDRRAGRHDGKLRLDIPVSIRGEEKIGLRRLVRNRYGINTDDYRLRAVVVDNYSHRRAAARLYTGNDYSRLTYLQRGPTRIRAPQGDQYGRWILHVDNARVNNIRVVLEPRRKHYAHRYEPTPRRPWYYDRWSRWIRW